MDLTKEYGFELKKTEQRQVDAIRDARDEHKQLVRINLADGEILADDTGAAIPAFYIVLTSRKFLVDRQGRVWRYAHHGTAKTPGRPTAGGTPRRGNAVEMWATNPEQPNGRWKPVMIDGQNTWRKVLRYRPIEDQVNALLGRDPIAHYQTVKGYKHPLEAPHAPSETDIMALQGKHQANSMLVLAQTEMQLQRNAGTDEQKEKVAEVMAGAREKVAAATAVLETPAPKPRGRPKGRTNKRATR